MLCLILKHFVSAFIALVIGRSQLLIDLHISHLSSAHARLCRTCGSRLSCRTYLVGLILSDLACQTYLVRLILSDLSCQTYLVRLILSDLFSDTVMSIIVGLSENR